MNEGSSTPVKSEGRECDTWKTPPCQQYVTAFMCLDIERHITVRRKGLSMTHRRHYRIMIVASKKELDIFT